MIFEPTGAAMALCLGGRIAVKSDSTDPGEALLHQGLVVVGLPYAFQGQMRNDEITGCSPYGATTIAGTQGERTPTENELAGARFQGKHVGAIAAKLAK